MLLRGFLDTLLPAQVMQAVQFTSLQEMGATLEILARRFPGLGKRLSFAVSGWVERTEWSQLLVDGKCFAAACTVNAAALQNAVFAIFNGSTTKRLLIKRLQCSTAAGAQIFKVGNVAADPALGAGPGGALLRQTSVSPTAPVATLEQGTPNGLPAVVATDWVSVPANSSYEMAGSPNANDFVEDIYPGFGLVAGGVTQAIAAQFAIMWAEVDFQGPANNPPGLGIYP